MRWLREHRLLGISLFIIGAIVLVMSMWLFIWPRLGQFHHDIFVGRWVITYPPHAGFEATIYDFKATGVLETIETYTTYSGLGADYVTGSVTLQGIYDGVRCPFGNRWYSRDPQTLVISAACTDGQQREITLTLQPIADGSFRATVVAVAGVTGWNQGIFGSFWRQCTTREDCIPYLSR